jgi:hypothetical protein
MALEAKRNRVNSERSGAIVSIYQHGDDPFLPVKPGQLDLIGRRETSEAPSLTGVTVAKAMGAAGTFTINVKSNQDLRQIVEDNSWIDISLTRHEERSHVMRGLIDTISRDRHVRNGATVIDYTITGRDFQKVWEDTIIWYNRFMGENAVGGETLQAVLANSSNFGTGSVPETVQTFLSAFLKQQNGFGRATWLLPASLKGVPHSASGVNFGDDGVVRFDFDFFSDDPPRFAMLPWLYDFHDSNLWGLASEWSDPQFCELYTELRLQGRFVDATRNIADPEESRMYVVLRDRPFPTFDAPGGLEGSAWWSLPLHELTPQEVLSDSTARSGLERKNMYLFESVMRSELTGGQIQLATPLFDSGSVKRHGVRTLNTRSRYTAMPSEFVGPPRPGEDIITLTDKQRRKLRDWFALNPYFYSGALALPFGRPEIRIGHKVRILGESENENETYYCESVQHQWSPGQPIRTQLGVTRGWKGTDNSLRSALSKAVELYKVPEPQDPASGPSSLVDTIEPF